jgi:hypothetical protein
MSNYTPFTTPAQSGGSSRPKNPNLQLVTMGMMPAIIYSVVNIGTHEGEYQGKKNKSNKLKIGFEFPTHRQLFYADDTELKPSVLSLDFTYSVSKNKKTFKKSKLLDFIEGLFGPLQEANYLGFDVSQVLDLKVFATIQHYTKQDGKIGAKIVNVSPFNPQLINPDTIQRTNPLARYHISMGFQGPEFASLYYFLRQEIKDSEEGKAHAAQGGKFVKFDENNQLVFDDESNTYTQAPAIPMGKMVMNGGYNYEQMKQMGWTDDALISAGHAYREAVVQQPIATPVPLPAQPTYQAPAPQTTYQQVPAQAPTPLAPQPVQAPPAPVAPAQPVLEMIDQTVTYDQYRAAGWSDEQLIQNGKARMSTPVVQAPAPPPVPVAPAPPAMPVAPAPVYTPPMPQAPAYQDPAAMFANTAPAPVQNMAQPLPPAPAPQVHQAVPMPQAPMPPAPISTFQQASTMPNVNDDEIDDLPF